MGTYPFIKKQSQMIISGFGAISLTVPSALFGRLAYVLFNTVSRLCYSPNGLKQKEIDKKILRW